MPLGHLVWARVMPDPVALNLGEDQGQRGGRHVLGCRAACVGVQGGRREGSRQDSQENRQR